MLIACDTCHRQYDVGDLARGDRVRCLCSALLSVPAERHREARMQHCSNCGGKLSADAARCEYCEAEVQLGDRGLGEACPGCFARMGKGARFCSTCGLAIRVESILKLVSSESCPRCAGRLAICEVEGEGRFTECTACGGIWLSEEVFEALTHARDRERFSRLFPQGPPLAEARRPETVRYLSCPVCGELMHRRNFAQRSGVVIDWCRGHGFWFDADELGRITGFIDAGGLERGHDEALARLRDERDRERRRRLSAEGRTTAPGDFHGPRPGNLFDALLDLWNSLL